MPLPKSGISIHVIPQGGLGSNLSMGRQRMGTPEVTPIGQPAPFKRSDHAACHRRRVARTGIVCILMGILLITGLAPIFCDAHETPVFRDYVLTGGIPKGHWEFSLDLLGMNDTLDIFDVRESEITSSSRQYQAVLGDLTGGRAIINTAVTNTTTVHFEYQYLQLETGPVEVGVNTMELALHQQLPLRSPVALAVAAGGRLNGAGDETIRRVRDIDAYLKRIEPRYSLRETPSHYLFSDGTFNVYASKTGRPPLQVSLEEMRDRNLFLRIITGLNGTALSANFFAEAGLTHIDSEIASNLPVFIPADFQGQIEAFPIDLERREYYWKAGFDLLIRGPFDLLANVKYEYQDLVRDDGLDYVDYNHVVRADLSYPVNRSLAVNVGGVYFRRQFNGVIPYMYNRYTQTTFDHDYGYVQIGLIVRL